MRKTKKLYQRLKDYPKEFQRASNHVEIIPFEDLWEIILERIDNELKGSFKNKSDKTKIRKTRKTSKTSKTSKASKTNKASKKSTRKKRSTSS